MAADRTLPSNLLLTGLPGCGKTTLIKRLVQAAGPIQPVGFYTAEIRVQGRRTGFELVDFGGRRRQLAHVNIKGPFKVGRYGVDVAGFEAFIQEIDFFKSAGTPVVIDEIGKMECFSQKFIKLLTRLLDSERRLVATIALRGTGPIAVIKQRGDVRLLTLTRENRDGLYRDLLHMVRNTYPLPRGP